MKSETDGMPSENIQLLISGGPGSGCTSTAEKISEHLDIPLFDSDSFFHKPSDPPFQEQYSPGERRRLLENALAQQATWIVSGSISTWELDFSTVPTHGVLLNIPREVRLHRLEVRQRTQFGNRIEPGGDMHGEHHAFMDWAADYESRVGSGRSLSTDREFLVTHCAYFLGFDREAELDTIAEQIIAFMSNEKPV